MCHIELMSESSCRNYVGMCVGMCVAAVAKCNGLTDTVQLCRTGRPQ